jgi:hypothetical protein
VGWLFEDICKVIKAKGVNTILGFERRERVEIEI